MAGTMRDMLKRLGLAFALVAGLVLPLSASTQQWIGGYYSATGTAAATWTAISSTEINVPSTGFAHGDAVLLATAINNDPANSGNGDLYANFSIVLGSTTTMAGTPNVQLYLYPLSENGSTYGDGNWTSAAAATPAPAAQYQINCSFPATQSTTGTITGTCLNIPLPPMKFKIVLYDNLNTTGNMATSGNTVYIQTYNFKIQ